MEIEIGYCKICDIKITHYIPPNVTIQVSDDSSPKSPYQGPTVFISKPLFCEECKKAIRKTIGR